MPDAGPAPGRGRLIILCGLPGSGKTTMGEQLARELDAVLLTADTWLTTLRLDLRNERRAAVEDLQWQVATRLLTLGGAVILDWGDWTRADRDAHRMAARALGASVELTYLDVPADVRRERIARSDRPQKRLDLRDFDGWAAKFEPPTADELALFDAAGDR